MLKKALQPALTGIEIKVASPCLEFLQAPSVIPPTFKGERLVMYGFLKSKGAKSATCTLQGQVLGETVQHQIEFSLDTASCSGFEFPIIHQLGAKRLLQEWEAESGLASAATRERKKAEAVDLSIKSGVICSSTAFVAIDEEEQKPIKGAMVVWNLEAVEPAHSYTPHYLTGQRAKSHGIAHSRKRPATTSPGKQVSAAAFKNLLQLFTWFLNSLPLKQQERVHQ